MYIKDILKNFMINVALFSLVLAIGFTAACGGIVTTEEIIEEEASEDKEQTAEEKEVEATAEGEEEKAQENMKIESTAFGDDEMIPIDYTCDGVNISPQFNISGVPVDTESLVLIVDDPDAPAGNWVHWAVWNIDPSTVEIPENSVPVGAVEGITDFGETGYRGPCPPSGTHRYFFNLYALDIILGLDDAATAQDVSEAMDGHILESAELVGLYGQ
jgi:Raf kinase inhibitor-like YbhB/YbcL family protein